MLNRDPKISPSVVRRLPIYLRHIQVLRGQGVERVSSLEMGNRLDLNPAQIRKDLASFGEFGKKGVGYEVPYLERKLRQILNLDRQIGVALIGAGHLGIALSNYARFQSERMTINGLFDSDPQKVGTRIGPLIVEHVNDLAAACEARRMKIGIIAVPAVAAQGVCDALVKAKIRVILNFAPASLRIPKDVHLRNTDFTTELQSLAFYIADD